MLQTWRWFGPVDKVSLRDARQAGAEAIVSALHGLSPGVLWTRDAIAKRQVEIATLEDGSASGLTWQVVESLPVSEAIKTRSGDWRADVATYKQSLKNIAAAGIHTICYNFMPVLDWTRTDLAAPTDSGGRAMRFDLVDFAAFDIHILARDGAADDYAAEIVTEAAERFAAMSSAAQIALTGNVAAGLPGAAEHWGLQELRVQLARYDDVDADALAANHVEFIGQIAQMAETLGLRLCCHPDDPPFPLLGLPRVISTAADVRQFLAAVDSPAVGLTFCTGSLGARGDNDLLAMVREFAPSIHFAHLRNVQRDTDAVPCSFTESDHLGGQADMVAVIAALLDEEDRRHSEGRADWQIPMRPDHGNEILTDVARGAQPGYPAVGRLKGLAELRGVICALQHGARLGS